MPSGHDLTPAPADPGAPPPPPAPSPAEEARTLVAGAAVGTLATLSDDGGPWASTVTYGLTPQGFPVLLVSTMAEHGRNLARDPRASLAVTVATGATGAEEALDAARVTLAGRVVRPEGAAADAARAAHVAAVPSAAGYAGWDDFSLWVLEVERVRWVGGFARMASVDGAAYAAAEPDPTAPAAAGAIVHLNADHADALLDMAHGLAGRPDATAAPCVLIDRYGLVLRVEGPAGSRPTDVRLAFAEVATAPGDLRAATVELTHRARAQG
ncbi:pyridoxamine 5'-phosphate oxidase family protein [Paraconexibacter antarcticus]|uniref:Pyridoxamine 5'-phosphate oxidase family protein n=1 Tax=Paraconexibacter antarcticus TaxID=2949664 RepID=A0ABY5DYS9_9ACTN|nr:DUF2470 domain-containing protein [Paraconexibacter antarcticus]UTI65992.1 pyridoxamine 5'-phosphate oxidase family protein [Paraconexibacter antarcticus]